MGHENAGCLSGVIRRVHVAKERTRFSIPSNFNACIREAFQEAIGNCSQQQLKVEFGETLPSSNARPKKPDPPVGVLQEEWDAYLNERANQDRDWENRDGRAVLRDLLSGRFGKNPDPFHTDDTISYIISEQKLRVAGRAGSISEACDKHTA